MDSGIRGQVTIGPTCPGPVRIGQSCDQPYQANISVLDPQGHVVTQFRADPQGRFEVPLPPGTYTLHPETPGVLPRAADQTVMVGSGQFTDVTIEYDTGIR